MRNKIAMALCAFYLISVIGVAMNMHFCSGKLSDVSFEKPAGCGMCKADTQVKDDDCCKDTGIEVKIKDSHNGGSKVDLPQNFGVALFFGTVISENVKMLLPNIAGRIENKAPPLSALVSLHIINCVFRN